MQQWQYWQLLNVLAFTVKPCYNEDGWIWQVISHNKLLVTTKVNSYIHSTNMALEIYTSLV